MDAAGAFPMLTNQRGERPLKLHQDPGEYWNRVRTTVLLAAISSRAIVFNVVLDNWPIPVPNKLCRKRMRLSSMRFSVYSALGLCLDQWRS